MTLTITVDFEDGDGVAMENNLNKAIDELSSVLERIGLGKHTDMELTGVDIDDGLKKLYKIIIK